MKPRSLVTSLGTVCVSLLLLSPVFSEAPPASAGRQTGRGASCAARWPAGWRQFPAAHG